MSTTLITKKIKYNNPDSNSVDSNYNIFDNNNINNNNNNNNNLRLEESHGDIDWETLRHGVPVHQDDPEGHGLGNSQRNRGQPDAGQNDLEQRKKYFFVSFLS